MNRRTLIMAASAAVITAPGLAATGTQLVPVVSGLDHPWGVAFLADGAALVTERGGRLRLVPPNGGALGDPIAGLPDIDVGGQGGLLGIALDPAFDSNRLVYLSFAEARDTGNSTSLFRAALSADGRQLTEGRVIFRQNMSAATGHHFGSRIVFGRDEHLYLTTGDRGQMREQAQNPESHIGKIMRLTRDGAPAPGNPALPGWAPEIWSIGHRNVQGATLNPATGELWTAEHGARGGDELNIPKAGKNYGWPIISYGREYSGGQIGEGQEKPGLEQPLHYWDPSIAPSGLTFYTGDVYPSWKGNLFVGALALQHVARLTLDGERVTGEERLFEGAGRMRDVVQGPDGHIYVLTDAGAPDGALLKIMPA